MFYIVLLFPHLFSERRWLCVFVASTFWATKIRIHRITSSSTVIVCHAHVGQVGDCSGTVVVVQKPDSADSFSSLWTLYPLALPVIYEINSETIWNISCHTGPPRSLAEKQKWATRVSFRCKSELACLTLKRHPENFNFPRAAHVFHFLSIIYSCIYAIPCSALHIALQCFAHLLVFSTKDVHL